MKDKVIVFGKGYLGTRLSETLGYEAVKINPLNLDYLGVYLDREKPDVVINAIGKTGRPNIDWCEDHREETMLSNVCAPANLAVECARRGIYFVHMGSGCIFDGYNDWKGFTEEDEPNFYGPQFYAKTKILAEKILKEFPGMTLRIRMPIDDRPHERNLINKLSKYSKVIDVQNSMTTVPHMIKTIAALVEKRRTGIYNLVNPGTISPAEIMKMYQEIVNPDHKFEVFSLSALDKITKGKRSNCYLRTDKLKAEGLELPEIHEAVKYCMQRYKDSSKS